MEPGIIGIDYFLPKRVETNADLSAQNPTWQMERLEEKCGIYSRHVAAPNETAGDLGYEAAKKLLDQQLVPNDEIDFLLFCTQCPDYFLPTTACILQDRLGLKKEIGALDFNLGCSGFIYGLFMAKQFIASGAARNVLLITAETYTKFINPADRSVRPLFGDGAAATLVGRGTDRNGGTGGSIGEFVLGTDGEGADKLIVPSGCARLPRSVETGREFADSAGCVRSRDNLFMDGMALMNFAIRTVPPTIDALLEKAGLSKDDIDWFVYHQANEFMLRNLAGQSDVPWEKMVLCMEAIGNTVSASIPIALAEAIRSKQVLPGQQLALIGFGVGYSWAACTARL
jgi:3-oxoacyl-[acyl-carrier-protein] synthase-3